MLMHSKTITYTAGCIFEEESAVFLHLMVLPEKRLKDKGAGSSKTFRPTPLLSEKPILV
jgi:hypothetical protein